MSSSAVATETVRCAIYTRKSTDEGLDQEFNSLDAQREAAEAYITSQRGEGWECLPERYDDGGYTGGNMDRLSRSLLDFARIIGALEQVENLAGSLIEEFDQIRRDCRLPKLSDHWGHLVWQR